MSTPSIPQRLHEILRDTFIPSELARLVHWKLKEWLHNIARPAGTHDEQVADLIDWAVRQGRLDELIRQAAAERAQRRDMQDLLADWDALAPATVGGPGNVGTSYRGSSPVASRAAGAGAGPLVQSLSPPAGVSRVAFLADHFDDIRKQTIPGAARDTLRREVSQELKDVAAAEGEELGGWCLHAQPGVRLAAVLRLEREPQPNFLQWLGERVAVEEPYIGLRAAAALRRAAEVLDDAEAVFQAVTDALDRLARVPDATDRQILLVDAIRVLEGRLRAGDDEGPGFWRDRS